jgi:hypothetical protein
MRPRSGLPTSKTELQTAARPSGCRLNAREGLSFVLRRPRTVAGIDKLGTVGEDVNHMSEDELAARRALQESLDLRDQGHTDA